MLKKLFSMFNKNKEKNSLQVRKDKSIEEVSAVSRRKVDTVKEKVDDEVFTVDFVSIRESGKTIKKAEVIFPANNQYIIINGEKIIFRCIVHSP